MRIYVAGPMTGLPDYNLPAFAEAALELDAVGHQAVNPGRHGMIPGFTWRDYIRRGLIDLMSCQAVAVLPGWENSKGATLEIHVARELDMPVRPLHEWIEAAA